MGSKARAVPKGDPLLRSAVRTDPAATENLDDVFTKPLSELLAYAPPNRGRSSTLQAPAVADDQEDRMPLFLERDNSAADDDGFHFKQREPAHREEKGQDLHAADPPAHWFEPEMREASPDFARPGFFRYAAWTVAAALMIIVTFGAAVFFGGAFRGSRPEAASMKQVAQTEPAPNQSAISFDQIFAAVSPPTQPENKPETPNPGASSHSQQGNTVGIATHDVKPQTDKSNERASAPAAAADLPRRIDQRELANLLKRGTELIDVGDIAAARLLLQRAADAREPQAAFALAGTYDPAVLSRVKAYGIAPDPAMARNWYEKAKEFGSSDAQRRLEQLPK